VGKYLDMLQRQEPRRSYDKNDINDINDKRYGAGCVQTEAHNPQYGFGRISRFCRAFEELQRRCPERVDTVDWQAAVKDGRAFLAKWGEQAEALGWTARDLFGLAPVPEKPASNYRRLSRYDLSGLVWLLKGRPVVALTESEAAIENATGAILVYRRYDKPALRPLGHTLADLT
jgi:hypothetical protein